MAKRCLSCGGKEPPRAKSPDRREGCARHLAGARAGGQHAGRRPDALGGMFRRSRDRRPRLAQLARKDEAGGLVPFS